MPATHRALIVQDHSCSTCGNRWTHSYCILTDENFSFYGGTPVGQTENTFPVARIAPRRAAPANACFRCSTAPIDKPAIRTPSPLSANDDLLDL